MSEPKWTPERRRRGGGVLNEPKIVSYAADAGLAAQPNGVLYHGLVRRIPRDAYGPVSLSDSWELAPTELQDLRAPLPYREGIIVVAPEVPIERVVTIDRTTGDRLVLWRVALRVPDPREERSR